MTQAFHPTTWIDQQRVAGSAPTMNVFDEILKAAGDIRRGQTRHADYRADQRVAQVHAIRNAAAEHDKGVGQNGMHIHTLCGEKVPTFGEMVQRWKSLR